MGKLVLTYLDYNREKGTASFPTIDLTAGNIAAQETLVSNLVSAIAGIADGTLNQTMWAAKTTPGSTSLPASAGTQREIKWLCRYHITGASDVRMLEIPCADVSQLANNIDTLDLTAGVGLAFKTAFDALVYDGALAVLDSVTLVFRNI